MCQTLHALGWRDRFERQMSADETQELIAARVGAHHGSQILCMTDGETFFVPTAVTKSCGMLAVGDWILFDPATRRGVRRLERESLIQRKAAGEIAANQLIAANVDTLFVVSSCNHDFNPSRLERYLALASDAGVNPVIVLTKSDLCEQPDSLRDQASDLKHDLVAVTVDARDAQDVVLLQQWCEVGQTVALVGSSGVGKSTLAMTMGTGDLETQEIREDDSKGRHTTTARSIHQLDAGGLLIDTPGMRELQLADCEDGVAEVFDEIIQLSQACRFRDCTHQGEPGCAVQTSIDEGELDTRRLKNYRKLQSEQARNAMSMREQRDKSRKLGQFYKSVMSSKRRSRGYDK